MDLNGLIPDLEQLAIKAGNAIMGYYQQDYKINYKADKSPATIADVTAEKIIIAGLKELTPDIPVIAEEQMASNTGKSVVDLKADSKFWLVDPLDGTKEFINCTGEFTVNIGLINNHKSVLGVIYAPALKELFSGIAMHTSAKTDLKNNTINGPINLITSKHCRTITVPKTAQVQQHIECGSSLKFCRIAKGKADYYPRPGRTMEWDTAAGHAILKAYGGNVFDENGSELTYQKPNFENPGFIAVRNNYF